MKLYQCRKIFCPYVDDPKTSVSYEDRVERHCMFANGVPEGMCCNSNSKQEGIFQKGIEGWM